VVAVEERDLAAEVVGVAHAADALVQVLEVVLGVRAAHRHRLDDLLVDHDVDVDALLGLAQKEAVEAELGMRLGRTTQVELGREPPVGDEDGLLGVLEDF